MERSPEVSVLVGAFNEGRRVESCITALLRQTGVTFEIIFVDDGSTDDTAAKVRRFSDPRICLVQKENGGLVSALNLGLQYCRGEMVARMDADDLCEDNRLEAQLSAFRADPLLALCGTWCIIKEPTGSSVFCPPTDDLNIRRFLQHDNPFVHSSVMVRRSSVLAVGGYRNIRPGEDYDLWIRVSKMGRLRILPEALVTRHEDRNLIKRPFYSGLSRRRVYQARVALQIRAIKALGWDWRGALYVGATVLKIARTCLPMRSTRDPNVADIAISRDTIQAITDGPLVSIVIPHYNDWDNLVRAIDSALMQTYKNTEVIVVDDGSRNDRSSELVQRYGSRVAVLMRPHSGVPDTLNAGIAYAQGKYVAINDSDDTSRPSRIALEVAVLECNSSVVCVGAHAITRDETGRVFTYNVMPCLAKDVKRVLGFRNPFVHSTMMYRRDAVLKAGGYSPRFPTLQDYDLWFRLLQQGEGVNLNEFLVDRVHRRASHTRVNKSAHFRRVARLKVRNALIAGPDVALAFSIIVAAVAWWGYSCRERLTSIFTSHRLSRP